MSEASLFDTDAVGSFMQFVRNAIRIPAGTKPRKCHGRRCGEMIYDVPKKSKPNETLPVSLKPYKTNPPGVAPTATDDGCGINHFADCVDAPSFVRPK